MAMGGGMSVPRKSLAPQRAVVCSVGAGTAFSPQLEHLGGEGGEKRVLEGSPPALSIAKWLKTQISVFSPPNVSPTQRLDWELGCDPAEPERDVILVGTPWSS